MKKYSQQPSSTEKKGVRSSQKEEEESVSSRRLTYSEHCEMRANKKKELGGMVRVERTVVKGIPWNDLNGAEAVDAIVDENRNHKINTEKIWVSLIDKSGAHLYEVSVNPNTADWIKMMISAFSITNSTGSLTMRLVDEPRFGMKAKKMWGDHFITLVRDRAPEPWTETRHLRGVKDLNE